MPFNHWLNWYNWSQGNYWSDYNGTDADHDGIGDTPYIIDDNNHDDNPIMAPIEIAVAQPPSPLPEDAALAANGQTDGSGQVTEFSEVLGAIASVVVAAAILALLIIRRKRQRLS